MYYISYEFYHEYDQFSGTWDLLLEEYENKEEALKFIDDSIGKYWIRNVMLLQKVF